MAPLKSENLYLRAVEPEDLEYLYKWENQSDVWQHSGTLNPYSKITIKNFIERSISESVTDMQQMRFMVCRCLDNAIIGTADIFDIDFINERGGVGLLIDNNFRGKGYASEALNMLCKYASETLLLNQLYVHIAIDNSACIKMFERSNFEKTGTLKSWMKRKNGYADVAVFQRILK